MANGSEIAPPPYALRCLEALQESSIEAWLDGGFVRNSLAKRRPGHVTFAVNASIGGVCAALAAKGVPYQSQDRGVPSVVALSEEGSIEITPFHVVLKRDQAGVVTDFAPTSDIESDLSRRDFTMNALAWHPERGIVDPYRGARDIRNGIVRCVGEADFLMAKEPLCSLRALRFASTMGFELESATKDAAIRFSQQLGKIDTQRIKHQLEKLLCGTFVRKTILSHTDELGAILPELIPMKGFDQCSRFHCYDVLEHTASVVSNSKASPFNRWAALLHDSGKPDTFFLDEEGRGHMPGHPRASVDHLHDVARRLGFDADTTHKLGLVILHHDDRPAATEKDVRRLYENLECNDTLFRAICDLMRADSVSKAEFCQMERIIITNEVEALFDRMKAEGRI